VLEARYDKGESVRADLADCIRGTRPAFWLVGVEVPEPGAERSSLPSGLTIPENENASDQRGECKEHDCDQLAPFVSHGRIIAGFKRESNPFPRVQLY
jgi:hypothetical protein